MTNLKRGLYPAFKADQITAAMEETIAPYLEKRCRSFETGGISGAVYTADSPAGSVMISHGFTESRLKYREMIYYFLHEGLNVCVHDHRGHGLNRASFGGPTDIDSFQTYVDDFAAVEKEVFSMMPRPHILYAHSMGGLIGAAFLEQHPEAFDRAVLSSPLLEVNCGGVPGFAARLTAEALCAAGKGKSFLPGQGEYSDSFGFEESASDCRERFVIYHSLQSADKTLQNGGSSCRWAREAMRMCARVLKKQALGKVRLPVLLFTAENDAYVLPGGQEKFISGIKNGKRVFVPGTKHEIYMGSDDVLPGYLDEIFSFINEPVSE